MPKYKVLERGFYNGRMYDPSGARPVLVTNEPFPKGKMPSWLEKMKDETAGERQTRRKAEREKAAQDANDAEEKRVAEEEISFIGDDKDGKPKSNTATIG